MCERLLNLQEIYVSGQNICIEVYGNSVGTITPLPGTCVKYMNTMFQKYGIFISKEDCCCTDEQKALVLFYSMRADICKYFSQQM